MSPHALARCWSWLVLASSAVAGPGNAPEPPEAISSTPSRRPRWRVGVGAQWRSLEKLSLHVSPHARLANFGRFVDATSRPPRGNGPAPGIGDRRYADGFVFADEGTPSDGTTWWWGYQNSSQVQGDSLVFNSPGSTTTTSVSQSVSPVDRQFEDDGSFGPVLELGVDWQVSAEWFAGIDATFSWLGIDVGDYASLASQSQESSTYRIFESDTFALHGLTPPESPYTGTEAGPGPVIDNVPTRRGRQKTLVGSREAVLTSVAASAFSADVFNFSLGPSTTWKHGRLSLRGGLGIELDVVSWDLSTTETVAVSRPSGSQRLARWRDSSSGTSVVPGFGVGGSVVWNLTPSLDLSLSAKWRTMENLNVQAGRTRAALDSSGFAVGLTLGHTF